MTMLTLHRLEVFIAVAKRLNVTHAARELHISQPAASREIRQLEYALSVRLIKKKRRGIELTESGSNLRVEVESILARLRALEMKYRQ
jgi:DNA-binding transcriptional LysR family regulator